MKKLILFLIIIFVGNKLSFSQTNISDYSSPSEYTIAEITVTGIKYLDKNTLISISGLELGERITIPGEDISSAIKKLWKQGLFSDISIDIIKIEDENIFLNISLKEHSKLAKFNFKGKIKKHDITELKEQLKLMRGKVLSENIINNSIYTIKLYFKDKGYNNIKVDYQITEDKQTINSSILTP